MMATKAYVGTKMYRYEGQVILFCHKAFHVISDTSFMQEEVPEVMKRMEEKPYIYHEPEDVVTSQE